MLIDPLTAQCCGSQHGSCGRQRCTVSSSQTGALTWGEPPHSAYMHLACTHNVANPCQAAWGTLCSAAVHEPPSWHDGGHKCKMLPCARASRALNTPWQVLTSFRGRDIYVYIALLLLLLLLPLLLQAGVHSEHVLAFSVLHRYSV